MRDSKLSSHGASGMTAGEQLEKPERMVRGVSIARAQDAPHFVVRSADLEIGRFGSLGAAFEAAYAAGAEISDNERRWLENWLLGGRCEGCEPGAPWLREVVSPGQRNWQTPSQPHGLH